MFYELSHLGALTKGLMKQTIVAAFKASHKALIDIYHLPPSVIDFPHLCLYFSGYIFLMSDCDCFSCLFIGLNEQRNTRDVPGNLLLLYLLFPSSIV